MSRSIVMVGLVALTLAACSGDGEGEAVETTAEPIATATSGPASSTPATSVPATTETPVITRSPATTVEPTTTPVSTSPASPTDAAVAAFTALKQAVRECVSNLDACDTAFYADYVGGDQLRSAIDEIEDVRSKGYVARNVQSLAETIEDVQTFAEDPRRVDIQFCAEDGVVLELPTETGVSLITDRFVSNRLIAEMRLEEDGRWRVYRYRQVGDPVVGEASSLCA